MTGEKLTPVFLISLPRSGSTLLQKLLATSPEFATTSEPWIALPVAYMRQRGGLLAEYWQESSVDALDDVVSQIQGGEARFTEIQAEFIRQIYAEIAGDKEARYFLDKTPRYYLITQFLAEAFPDARFIFLFRNPLDVVTSILRSWHKDTFSPHLRSNDIDIWRGPELLANSYATYRDRSVRVDYEKLVADPQGVLGEVATFLDLKKLPPDAVGALGDVKFAGRMGDPTGGKKYDGVASHSVDSFIGAMKNPYRKAFFKAYIRAMPDVVFDEFRIDRAELLKSVSKAPTSMSGMMRDLVGLNWYRLSKLLHEIHQQPGFRPFPKTDRKARQLG